MWKFQVTTLLSVITICASLRYGSHFDEPVLHMVKSASSDVKDQETTYKISDTDGYGRIFDGIGGLSGGGATSRLLVNYPEKYRNQILDYLFKPNFGASLHILKVEIGGDAQSTDGSESSHMHTEDETPNFNRGYEWWLMKEAKQRNPDIKLVGLPWAWPGWVGQGTAWPFTNNTKAVGYIISWILGAKSEHGLSIDYIGIWNERPYDAGYIKLLRKMLDGHSLSNVAIIAADESLSSTIAQAILNDSELSNAVEIIGTHYPGTISTSKAIQTQKKLWASEDYSTYNDYIGAGCWARILNQNYVNGNMTATISWNLIASYYDNLPFKRCSLMTAVEPWSGHYEVPSVVWITAHTTQFSRPGWMYLKTVGHLEKGGSYVALSNGKELTIVVETMSHDHSKCIRPPLPGYTVEAQSVTFELDGSFASSVKSLNIWTSEIGKDSTDDQIFKHSTVTVSDNKFTIMMEPDKVVTLTTVSTGNKGFYDGVPASSPFPFPYEDNFDNMTQYTEAHNFADQSGTFEIYENKTNTDGHQWTMRQVVPQRPLTWCDDSDSPITLIGNHSWTHMNVTVDVKLEDSSGVFVAARVDAGGCDVRNAKGVFLWLHKDQSWTLTTTLERNKYLGRCYSDWGCWQGIGLKMNQSGWNTISVAITDTVVYGYLNSLQIFKKSLSDLPDIPKNGWAAFGVQSFAYAQFDNFVVKKA
uniref:galactocerebrosidase-like n=1 Tax=Styela clava TaxID=7725 RepID=UPI001939B1B8|nr:galactocerebrosidase-like [Styela clava]